MTREEALKILDTIPTIGEQVDALEMAISALEQTTPMSTFDIAKQFGIKLEPCEDAVSRTDIIHYLECHKDEIHPDVMTFVKHLPTVSTTKNIVNHGTMNITL